MSDELPFYAPNRPPVPDKRDMYEAIVAIATIVDDIDNPAEARLEGIRVVLAAIGMLRVRIPRTDPTTPRRSRSKRGERAATAAGGDEPSPTKKQGGAK